MKGSGSVTPVLGFWVVQEADPLPGNTVTLVAMSWATGWSPLGCVAGENMPGSLENRSKDAVNHVGCIFMTNNTESFIGYLCK